MERNQAAARHRWAGQHAWLLLNLFPFQVGQTIYAHCTVDVGFEISAGLILLHHFQCVESFGKTGHNIEYVLKLAEWARATFPEVEDEHLYGLEEIIRRKAEERGLVLENLGRYSVLS